MAWRIVGGLSGWLVSLAPLVIVNILAFVTVIDPGMTPIAGGVGLILAIALGGLTAGLLGGKRGGGTGGAIAGAIASALFTASLVALMYRLRAQGQLPYLLALHPLRAMGAIGFIACLLLGVAVMAGASAGRRQARHWEQSANAAQPARMAERRPSAPSGHASRPNARPGAGATLAQPRSASRPAQRDQRDQRDQRHAAETHARGRSSRW